MFSTSSDRIHRRNQTNIARQPNFVQSLESARIKATSNACSARVSDFVVEDGLAIAQSNEAFLWRSPVGNIEIKAFAE